MSAFLSKKLSLLLLLCSWCTALGAVFLMNYVFAGPRLGPVYDILRTLRPSVPVSREIVLIETDEVVEAGDIYTVLMTLSELGASDLLI
ncbi:MAG: hypothetical protein LBI06_05530, partial [Treponema sp.]|nr:hypothetical protein [Treponema sp.]